MFAFRCSRPVQQLLAASRAAVLIGIVSCGSSDTSAGEPLHLVGDGSYALQPVSNEAISARIQEVAVQYRAYAPIPRVGFFDIAFPANAEEYNEMAGYGLMLVSVLVQDEEELPLTRVYVDSDSTQQALTLVTSVLSTVNPEEEIILATLGPHRMDALYLFPVVHITTTASLLADFAKNREGFKLDNFRGEVPEMIRHLPIGQPTDDAPSGERLLQMVEREFPGFVER
jgi:hypothetical protein